MFEFRTIGVSMGDVVSKLFIPQPDYIKLDVGGIEHLILKGGHEVLKNIKGIFIEVNDAFQPQGSECHLMLNAAGLILKEELQSEMVSSSTTGFQNIFNQIWFREVASNFKA